MPGGLGRRAGLATCPPSFWRSRTQEQIAELVGKDRSVISRIVQNTKFGEMHNFLEQGKDMAWIADHYHIDIPLTFNSGDTILNSKECS